MLEHRLAARSSFAVRERSDHRRGVAELHSLFRRIATTVPAVVFRPMTRRLRRPLSRPAVACGLLAMGIAAVAMIATLRAADWSLTALPRVDSKTRLGTTARILDPGFHTVHPGAYGGHFYWGVAVVPLALGRVHNAFDK